MSLRAIVEQLGGDLYDHGRRANIPAPGHSRTDRSVSLVLSEGRVVVHAFNGADWRDILDDLRRQGLIDAANTPRSLSAVPAAAAPAPVAAQRLSTARAIWCGGRAVAATLSERYVRMRRVTRELPGEEVLRHHLNAPISAYGPASRTKPAIVAAITASDGSFSAIELTYLDPNGRRAIGLRLSRKTVGLVPPGSAIRLDPAGLEMVVGEGLMTTLSATQAFELPGWALMSTRNLRGWTPPEEVRSVLIAADRGTDGEGSAEHLAGRLHARGVACRIALPPTPYGDWNEAAGG